jgi:hypothetical protein
MSDLPCSVLDVNETLLGLQTMVPTFERVSDDKSATRLRPSNFMPIVLRSASGPEMGESA